MYVRFRTEQQQLQVEARDVHFPAEARLAELQDWKAKKKPSEEGFESSERTAVAGATGTIISGRQHKGTVESSAIWPSFLA